MTLVIKLGGGGLGLALTPRQQVIDPQESVLSRFDPTPGTPVGPSVGDRYISLATANGWLINNIYEWNGAWVETVITEGASAWVEDEGTYYFFTGVAWIDASGIIDHALLIGVTGDQHHPKLHAADHVNGTDDIRDATSSLKGLATAAQITELEALSAGKINVIASDTEPALSADERVAIWNKTSATVGVFLLFRLTAGVQYALEFGKTS